MPIYEYSCKKCGKTIEVIQKFSDNPLKKHEKCGGALTKLISASGFQFKGTGWYVTDYARKSGGGDKAGESESSSSKTESKDSASTATATSSKEASPTTPAPKTKPTGDSKKSSAS